MPDELKLIHASDFCSCHNIEIAFLSSLNDIGLLQIIEIESESYIPENQLDKLERIIRLHRELEINIEGIDTIDHLLKRLEYLQQEVINLKNRLRLYEEID